MHKNHYDGSSDSPTWSTDSTGVWSRNVTDLAGNVAVIVNGTTSGTGSAPVFVPTGSTVQISDMHGDFVATMATDTGTNTLSSSCAFDDYGATFQSAGLSPSGKYGWLGSQQRPTELTGLMLMGVRVYNPATGRFLQVDPVLGGNAGPYLYPTDPILMLDLNGMYGYTFSRIITCDGCSLKKMYQIMLNSFMILFGLLDEGVHMNALGGIAAGQKLGLLISPVIYRQPVFVIASGCSGNSCSMKLRSLWGHLEGASKDIIFSVHSVGGNRFLFSVKARGQDSWWQNRAYNWVNNHFLVPTLWGTLAMLISLGAK